MRFARPTAEPAAGDTPADWRTHRDGGCEWTARTDVPDLLGWNFTGAPPLDHWCADGLAITVKSGPHRTVYRVATGDDAIYIKRYRVAGVRAWFQNNLRSCRAYREAAACALVSSTGIATAQPVAFGRILQGPFTGENYYLCREVTNAIPLDLWLHDRREVPRFRRRLLAESLAKITAKMHVASLYHADYHAGNLLVQSESGANDRVYLIDLHPVRRATMTARRRHKMIGMLAASLGGQITRGDEVAFLDCYLAAGGFEENRDEIVAASGLEFLQRHGRADRKWKTRNRRFQVLDDQTTRCRGLTELGSQSLGELRSILASDKEQFDVERQCTTRPRSVGVQNVVVRPTNDACTAWTRGHALHRRGIPTPRPLLFLAEKSASKRGGVILELTAPLKTFERCFDETGTALPFSSLVLFRLGRLVRLLHDRNQTAPPHAIGISDRQPVVATAELVTSGRMSEWNRRMAVASFLAGLSEFERHRFLLGYAGTHAVERLKYAGIFAQTSIGSTRNTGPAGFPSARTVARRAAALLLAMVFAPPLLLGCKSTPVNMPVVSKPGKHSIRADHLVVISDFELGRDHELLEDLTSLRTRVTETLQLPEPRRDVTVYLFSDELSYRRYLESVHPGLPPRRAYFVGTKSELAVYSYWGERVQEDLRHEYTHGILHASLKTVPLWLDEGLAEYFEVPGEPGSLNGDYPQQLAIAVSRGWRPDIDRLEAIEEFSAMKRIDYQESWAWVHYLLHSSPDTRIDLVQYLHDLRDADTASLLSERMAGSAPGYPARFLGYVANLNSASGAVIRAETPLF